MKNYKGITLTSLIITIIVMVILAGIALLFSVGDEGVLERATSMEFKQNLIEYKDELELYKNEKQIENLGKNANLEDTLNYDKMKEYIPSFDRKYEGVIGVEDNELFFVKTHDNEKQAKYAEELGIKIKDERATIDLILLGQGTIDGISEDRKIQTKLKETINLKAEDKTILVNGKEIKYEFVGWYIKGELVGREKEYSFSVVGDKTITAVFETDATVVHYLDANGEKQMLLDETTNLSTYTKAGITKTSITRVDLGKNCTTIPASAFDGCKSLTKLLILNAGNITYEWQPFSNCTGLKEIILGDMGKSVSSINSQWPELIFSGCTQKDLIIKIYAETGTTSITGAPFGATNATVEYYDAETGELVNLRVGGQYQGNKEINWTQIPNEDKVTEIIREAFSGCANLALTKLPENIKKINQHVFNGCANLKIEKIPEEVTFIGASAFNGCKSLRRLEIPNAGNITYENVPFSGCTGLKEIILGDIGKPVKSINSNFLGNIFYNCTQKDLIIKIYVETGTTSITGAPFGATNATIEYYDSETGELVNLRIGGQYQGNKEINWTQIPNEDKVTGIIREAFYGCSNLALTSIPENIQRIDQYVFNGCTNLKIEKIPEGVTSIGAHAFTNCKSLTRLEIPNAGNITYEYMPFSGCTGLKEIILGDIGKPVSTINSTWPELIFYGCTNKDLIIKIYIDDVTTSIPGIPFRETNAKIIYLDSVTGEEIK